MRIKWLVDTYAVLDLEDKRVQLLIGQEYDVPENNDYIQTAIARGWAEVIPPESKKKPAKQSEAE